MTFATFVRSWRACIQRRPFRPYLVQFITGETITIIHPEAIRLYRETAALIEPTGQVRFFDAASICQLINRPIPPSAEEAAPSAPEQE